MIISYQPSVSKLLSLGEPLHKEKRNYIALGLSQDAIPELIRMALDEDLHSGPPDSLKVWAPVHAWRALAQLKATEAIAPLLTLLRRADDHEDDWMQSDLPETLAQFGAPALNPVTDYLVNSGHGEWAHVAASKILSHIGQTHPELRSDCIARLSAQLEKFAEQSETINGLLVVALLDLRAVEAMPVIERAFASGRVDEAIVGDVEDVQIEFGLKSQREHPRKPNRLTELREKIRAIEKENAELRSTMNGMESDWAQPYLAPPKIGRNEPCPCGSGKKYKKCCLP